MAAGDTGCHSIRRDEQEVSKLIVYVILAPFLVFVLLTGVLYFNHVNIQNEINQINYSTVEAVTSLGMFPESLYFSMIDEINRYSQGNVGISDNRYEVTVKLEKNIKEDIYDTYFFDSDQIKRLQAEYGLQKVQEINSVLVASDKEPIPILNEKLGIGDRITIYLEDRSPTTFGRLINFRFGFLEPRENIDYRITSQKSSVIATDPKNFISGYEVVAMISQVASDPTLAVSVQTSIADIPRYYGQADHPVLAAEGAPTRTTYGNQPDEKGEINTSTGGGRYFIYGPGTFAVTETWVGEYRYLAYRQQ